jgi:DNA-directed RNA polymerase specialized sigma24 family protein
MLEKTELPLIEAARKGDEMAFRGLLEPLNRELSVYAYRLLAGFQDAEDALQEARLKAWRGLGSYEPRAGFRAWMYRIVTNTCPDMLRTRRPRVLPQDVGPPAPPGPPSTAYVRGDDGRYTAVCLTVLTVDPKGSISDLTVFVLPAHFGAWGYPPTLG